MKWKIGNICSTLYEMENLKVSLSLCSFAIMIRSLAPVCTHGCALIIIETALQNIRPFIIVLPYFSLKFSLF